MGGPDPFRQVRRQWKQRTKTLKIKAHEIAKFCEADVYLIVSSSRGTLVYNSVQDRQWPPPDDELELHYSKLSRDNPDSMEGVTNSGVADSGVADSEVTDSRDRRLGTVGSEFSTSPDLKRVFEYFAVRAELLKSMDDRLAAEKAPTE